MYLPLRLGGNIKCSQSAGLLFEFKEPGALAPRALNSNLRQILAAATSGETYVRLYLRTPPQYTYPPRPGVPTYTVVTPARMHGPNSE
jgi:hypothetical protein